MLQCALSELSVFLLYLARPFSFLTSCCNNALWPLFAFCVYVELFRHNVNIGNTIRFLFSDIVPAQKVVLPNFDFPSSAPDVGCKETCDWRGVQQAGQVWRWLHHHRWCSRSLWCQGGYHEGTHMIETFSLRYILNMFRVCLNSSKNGKAKRQSVYKITFGETTGITRIHTLSYSLNYWDKRKTYLIYTLN